MWNAVFIEQGIPLGIKQFIIGGGGANISKLLKELSGSVWNWLQSRQTLFMSSIRYNHCDSHWEKWKKVILFETPPTSSSEGDQQINCHFQRADIGMGLYSWLKERAQVVDYSRMLGADTWTVLMRNKGTANVIRGNLISPFDYQVGVLHYPHRSITNSLHTTSYSTIKKYMEIAAQQHYFYTKSHQVQLIKMG